jgi:SAM-dependent methyltransferase
LIWGLPLRRRREFFLAKARHLLRGCTVFEAGCGSAGLLEELFDAGIKRYIGCDFSTVAIEAAQARAVGLGRARDTEFVNLDVLELPSIEVDFAFSLGLFDWLQDDEIICLNQRVRSTTYLHSFSERRRSVSQALHRAYVMSTYGKRDKTYTPLYRKTSQVTPIVVAGGAPAPIYWRHAGMSFSTFALHAEGGA